MRMVKEKKGMKEKLICLLNVFDSYHPAYRVVASKLSEKSVVIFYTRELLYDVYGDIHFKCPHCFDSEGDQYTSCFFFLLLPVFFSSSFTVFFFVAHFFCTLHRIRNAVFNGIHSLCDERKIPK